MEHNVCTGISDVYKRQVRDGYRYIDSAAMYGNEAEVGEAIRTCGVQREELFISSKIWPTRFDDPDASLAQSLRDLGIDALEEESFRQERHVPDLPFLPTGVNKHD